MPTGYYRDGKPMKPPSRIGTTITEKHKEAIRIANSRPNTWQKDKPRLDNRNEKHHNWKGDKVTKGSALHKWVRRRLPEPEKCAKCKKKKPLDLSNKSGKYLRELSDWWYLCRSCHIGYDRTRRIK